MPKHDYLTPKAISNRIKARGLQKLRWYCQMCKKQCRDENGFKCHCLSESHNRQMMLFSQNPKQFMNDYSREFETAFLFLARTRDKRVKANDLYKEVISDRHHIHMNATIWSTLTNFVLYLGKSGKCTIDKVEKDWYVQFNRHDAKEFARKDAERRSTLLAMGDEDYDRKLIEQKKQIDEMLRLENLQLQKCATNSKKIEKERHLDTYVAENRKTVFALVNKEEKPVSALKVEATAQHEIRKKNNIGRRGKLLKTSSNIERLMNEEKESRRADTWLLQRLVVKIICRKFNGGRFNQKKAVVENVVDETIAEVCVVKSGEKFSISQDFLVPVLPPLGKPAIVIKGRLRGEKCNIKNVIDNKKLNIVLESLKTEIVVDLDCVCKLSSRYIK